MSKEITESPLGSNEAARLEALRQYNLLDTSQDKALDEALNDIARLAAHICGTPIALITLVEEARQWFKARVGTSLTQTSRTISFCTHALQGTTPLVIGDTSQDTRFASNPLVTSDLGIRFYAGMPLITPDGHGLGALCVLDKTPRSLLPEQQEALVTLGRAVMALLEQRRLLEQVRQAEQRLRAAHDEMECNVIQRTKELLEQKQFLRRVLDTDPNFIFVKDEDGVFTLANMAVAEAYGTTPEQLVGKRDTDFNPSTEQINKFRHDEAEVLRTGQEKFIAQEKVTNAAGQSRWVQTIKRPLLSPGGQVREVLGISTDITAHKEAEEALTHQAFHDSLTGLPNRALFLNHLERALSQAKQTQEQIAVLFVDLDNFKVVNDSLGHDAGDTLLKLVGQRLLGCARPGDTVARIGGDEFTLILASLGSEDEAVHVAECVTQTLGEPIHLNGREITVTISIGIAIGGRGHEETVDILRHADMAMYEAKIMGKSGHVMFLPSMNERAMQRLDLEIALRRAIEEQELRLLYQPIVNLATERIVGVEALVRWQHPERGMITPDKFIPLAEETGLILPLGNWVLREACRQGVTWQNQHPDHLPLMVSVNLSARQLSQVDLVETVQAALQETGFAPGNLKLEITESVMMGDTDSAIAKLRQLRALGVRLAIDDFGTGYSSMSYLSTLPINTLKIDRAFVSRIGQGKQDATIVRAIVSLARGLNLETTCEGIETAEQHAYLTGLGCDRGQGYYFARPLPAESVEELLSRTVWGHADNQPKGLVADWYSNPYV